jgi:outer membrane protein OmpA-like peptidoglycan-associated protein
MIKRFLQFSLLLTGFAPFSLVAQQTIKLDNPSFEDFPQPAHTPANWYDCGFASETPPDVQPNPQFQVSKPAKDGKTYLGMVVRDNNTWEAVGQRLKIPLQKGQCYQFSLQLAKSELYVSKSKVTNKDVNYVTPAIVRIWGGNTYCSKDENLADSEPIENGQWKTYTFRLKPKSDYNYIMIEAFYKMPTLFPYNGNILVDNASDLVPTPCDSKPAPVVVASVEPKPKVKITPPTPKKPDSTKRKPPTTVEPGVVAEVHPPVSPTEPPIMIPTPIKPTVPKPEPKAEKLKEGQVIKIQKLQFDGGTFTISPSSYTSLDEVYAFLSDNPNMIVEIGGHTNGNGDDIYCDALSTNRANAVRDYLANKGIDRSRLKPKGYGKHKPVAREDTKEGRAANQRVEIKILSLNG